MCENEADLNHSPFILEGGVVQAAIDELGGQVVKIAKAPAFTQTQIDEAAQRTEAFFKQME